MSTRKLPPNNNNSEQQSGIPTASRTTPVGNAARIDLVVDEVRQTLMGFYIDAVKSEKEITGKTTLHYAVLRERALTAVALAVHKMWPDTEEGKAVITYMKDVWLDLDKLPQKFKDLEKTFEEGPYKIEQGPSTPKKREIKTNLEFLSYFTDEVCSELNQQLREKFPDTRPFMSAKKA